MNNWNLKQEWKKVIFTIGIVFIILILDLVNGSSFRFMEITGPECLATHAFQISILVLISSLFLKKEIQRNIQKWSLIIIIPILLVLALENNIKDYQYKKTRKSLEKICFALNEYKDNEGKYPQTIELLIPRYLKEIPKSGFGLFDSAIKYELIENKQTRLDYKVKFGFICEAYDCGGGLNFSTWARC